jgi:hypothetical protein
MTDTDKARGPEDDQGSAAAEQFIGALLDLTSKLQTTLDRMEGVIEYQKDELQTLHKRLEAVESKLGIEAPSDS